MKLLITDRSIVNLKILMKVSKIKRLSKRLGKECLPLLKSGIIRKKSINDYNLK